MNFKKAATEIEDWCTDELREIQLDLREGRSAVAAQHAAFALTTAILKIRALAEALPQADDFDERPTARMAAVSVSFPDGDEWDEVTKPEEPAAMLDLIRGVVR